MAEATTKALAAKAASKELKQASETLRNAALLKMADALSAQAQKILEANNQDMAAAKEAGTADALLDRLMLNEDRLSDIASALRDLADLPDPLNKIQEERTLYNGLSLKRASVPLGVVAVVYEARPNVTADAAGIALKSGNAVVLRGGSMASKTCLAIAEVLEHAAVEAGLPEGCIQCIESTDRAETDELMSLHGIVDVLIPRGGAGLINHCVEHSRVPVIETGTGNCHVYVHESANLEMAKAIVINAKCRRFGVCNAAETLLVDGAIAQDFLTQLFPELIANNVELHLDETAQAIAAAQDVSFQPATQADWETEYLGPHLAVRVVSGLQEALDHIDRYSTMHSEAIVAQAIDAQKAFVAAVDAAAVYVNASTAFTDGGQFGLGAEIGISTQKLHVRGPFALEALTSYKYIVEGEGQVRS